LGQRTRRILEYGLTLVFMLCCLHAPTTTGQSKYDGTIKKGSDGRCEAYMIPPFASNHASFLERLPNGDMFIAWFSGTEEGASNVSIVLSHLPSGSNQWSQSVLISRRQGYSNQNPVLYYDTNTSVFHCFHSQQKADAGETESNIWHLQSLDNGKTWSEPVDLFPKAGSFDRNRVLQTRTGALLLPVYFAVAKDADQISALEVSHDHGNTWTEQDIKGSNYLVQPSVVQIGQTENNNLKAFFRDRRAQFIYTASSHDEGITWTIPTKTTLPNNNAGIEANVLKSGAIVLAFNNCNKDRNSISVGLSYDEGGTWKFIRDLEPEQMEEALATEYSYPTVLQSQDENIHLTYTYNRDTIKYIRITEDWIKNGTTKGCIKAKQHS